MFEKGRSFVMAGGLVKAYDGHRFVYLHLLCQGAECIGKALLLAHDYEKYEPRLGPGFGHDLEALVAEVQASLGRTLFSEKGMNELKILNSYYKKHILRYGNAMDFRKEAATVQADTLHLELVNNLTWQNQEFSEIESGS